MRDDEIDYLPWRARRSGGRDADTLGYWRSAKRMIAAWRRQSPMACAPRTPRLVILGTAETRRRSSMSWWERFSARSRGQEKRTLSTRRKRWNAVIDG